MNDNNASFHHQLTLEDRHMAEVKLCRFFKSFGLDALGEHDRLIAPYLERAAAFWRPHTGANFGALAVQEAEADLETWFAALLDERLENRAFAVMTGRAAFLMCSGPRRWADQLLCPINDLDPSFVQAIKDHAPVSVPPSELGEMHHQPYVAWSPGDVMSRALPLDRSFFQGLAGLLRRDAA